MKDILSDLIDLIDDRFGGHVTECGGEFSVNECEGCCKLYFRCKDQYAFSDKLAALKKRVSEIQN
jgi:hypothetical protein